MTGTGELVVELGEGFTDDEVAVLVDGREAWHADGVTTNWSIGLADVVRVPADAARPHEVAVRARGATAAHRLAEAGDEPAVRSERRVRARFTPEGDLQVEPADGGPIF